MTDLETLTSPQPVKVDVAAIRKELTGLWKEAAAPAQGEAAPVTRTCLLNFVVWTEGAGPDPEIERTVARVASAHPARVILLQVDSGAKHGSLQAWISAHCRLAGSGAKQVCCEQITIRSGAGSVRHLPGLASALCAADLPVALWVTGTPAFDEPAFRRLAELSDRLLIDSARLSPETLGRLARFDGELKQTALGDLNWRRLRPWQDLVAGFFDSPLCLPLLDGIRGVTISGGEGAETSARIFTGWVSAALEDKELVYAFERSKTVPAGSLAKVRLDSNGKGKAAFIVDVDPKTGCFTARIEMEGTCPVPRKIRPVTPEPWVLVCGQLERLGRDPLYEAALRRAADLG